MRKRLVQAQQATAGARRFHQFIRLIGWLTLAGCGTLLIRWIYVRLRPIPLVLSNATTPALGKDQITAGMRRIIVSDLHLGGGDRLDDFDADEPFAAFVREYVASEPTELILAGDTFEFLQVRLPTIADDDWSEHAAVVRLQTMIDAHHGAIEALREFIADPSHQLTILIGNHDFELHYHGAKAYLREVLGLPTNDPRLRFAISYHGDGIYLVHGNQFDPWNRFKTFEGICEPFEVVRGTQLVKEIYNDLEEDPIEVAPLLDNVKPSSAFFWYLVALPRFRHRPIRRFVLRGVFRLTQMMLWPEPHQMPIRADGPPASLRFPLITALWAMVARIRQQRVSRQQEVARQVSEFASNVEPLEPMLEPMMDQVRVEASRQVTREIRAFNDRYAKEMALLARQPANAQYHLFICGHTHLARMEPLGGHQYYVNTGTWTDIIYDIGTMRRLKQRYPFLEITYPSIGAPEGRLLVWNSTSKQPTAWYDEIGLHRRRRKRLQRLRKRTTRRLRRTKP